MWIRKKFHSVTRMFLKEVCDKVKSCDTPWASQYCIYIFRQIALISERNLKLVVGHFVRSTKGIMKLFTSKLFLVKIRTENQLSNERLITILWFSEVCWKWVDFIVRHQSFLTLTNVGVRGVSHSYIDLWLYLYLFNSLCQKVIPWADLAELLSQNRSMLFQNFKRILKEGLKLRASASRNVKKMQAAPANKILDLTRCLGVTGSYGPAKIVIYSLNEQS